LTYALLSKTFDEDLENHWNYISFYIALTSHPASNPRVLVWMWGDVGLLDLGNGDGSILPTPFQCCRAGRLYVSTVCNVEVEKRQEQHAVVDVL
jgi:hypothetical protein